MRDDAMTKQPTDDIPNAALSLVRALQRHGMRRPTIVLDRDDGVKMERAIMTLIQQGSASVQLPSQELAEFMGQPVRYVEIAGVRFVWPAQKRAEFRRDGRLAFSLE